MEPCLYMIVPLSKGEHIRKILHCADLIRYPFSLFSQEALLYIPVRDVTGILMKYAPTENGKTPAGTGTPPLSTEHTRHWMKCASERILACGDNTPDHNSRNPFYDMAHDITLGIKWVDNRALEKKRTLRYQDCVTGIPDDLEQYLPTSYDIIGHVAIIKLTDELKPYASAIGDALILHHSNVRTVVLDKGVKGSLRIRDLLVVSGDPDTLTTVMEYGLTIWVDPARVYYSPRLATERKRVVDSINQDDEYDPTHEHVVDMFAGVGPFSLMIAKYCNVSSITAIDLNPDAIALLEKNKRQNRKNSIQAICGDARDVAPTILPADRVIMNLPHSAFMFLETVFPNLRTKGVIYYYEMLPKNEIDDHINRIIKVARGCGRQIGTKNVTTHSVRSFSPNIDHVGLEIRVDN